MVVQCTASPSELWISPVPSEFAFRDSVAILFSILNNGFNAVLLEDQMFNNTLSEKVVLNTCVLYL